METVQGKGKDDDAGPTAKNPSHKNPVPSTPNGTAISGCPISLAGATQPCDSRAVELFVVFSWFAIV